MLIPKDHKINFQLTQICEDAKVIIFAGLPGTGKSLLINHTYHLAASNGLETQLIQWDVARKEFAKGPLKNVFPNKDGQTHKGLRLSAGKWLMTYVKDWFKQQKYRSSILLIEAPLIGHRFSELAHKNQDQNLEQILRSSSIQFVLPVPSEEVRLRIEKDRRNQISESAKTWSGAKPSVMLQLWKDTLEIARALSITKTQDDAYRADIYTRCYEHILRHRHCITLFMDQIFEVGITDEKMLHGLQNELPSAKAAQQSVDYIQKTYTSDYHIIKQVDSWYKT